LSLCPLEDLEKVLNLKLDKPIDIKFKVTSEYEEGINQLANGSVHFSRLGPASFVIAKEKNPNLKLLAMESKKGARIFNGVIAIHKDSPLTSVAQLKGHSFAFGDPLSTIGRYLSQSLLLEKGLNSTDFSTLSYLGRHDKVGMAVAAKDFTAGALKESTFDKLVATGYPIKCLTKFDNVTKPWVAHPSLDSEIAEALKQSLLELKSSTVSKDGFLTAEDEYYTQIRVAMKQSENF